MRSYCPCCMTAVQPGGRCPGCGVDPAAYQPASHHFPPGRLLHDRYLVGRVLGEGGFGITYLGIDVLLERKVAIKEYFPNVFVHRESSLALEVTCYTGAKQPLYERGRDQFLQEARVMARFDKIPEMVQVLDFFAANNTAYIVMEFLEGDTLRTLLSRQGRIPAPRLLELLGSVLRAVHVMHGAGIIHRDISPDNLMLLPNGLVKLLDFGCARGAEGDQTMTVMLKHGYAPMEQYTGHDQGPWTDLYAVCATIYTCLTGQTPPRALERLGKEDPLVPPNALGAGLTSDQERALLRGLAVEPSARPQSAAELYAGLYGRPMTGIPVPEEETARLTEERPPAPAPEEEKTALLTEERPPASAPGEERTALLTEERRAVPVPPQFPPERSAPSPSQPKPPTPTVPAGRGQSQAPLRILMALLAIAQGMTALFYLLEIVFSKMTSGASMFLGMFGRRVLYSYIILAPLLAVVLLAALRRKKGHRLVCLLSAVLQMPVLIRFLSLSNMHVLMFTRLVRGLYGGLWHLLLLCAWVGMFAAGRGRAKGPR